MLVEDASDLLWKIFKDLFTEDSTVKDVQLAQTLVNTMVYCWITTAMIIGCNHGLRRIRLSQRNSCSLY